MLRKCTNLIAAMALTIVALPLPADDTDVFLLPSSVSRDDSPNVLVVFDNSASMEDNTLLSSTYIPGTTYDTDGGFDTDKIYWTNNSTAPSSGTSQVFLASANQCTTATSVLASTGFYQDKVVAWKVGNPTDKGRWADLAELSAAPDATNHTECQSDSPADAGSGNTYVKKGNSIFYTDRYDSNSSKEVNWTDFDTVTLYLGNYLNYLAAASGSGANATRLQVAKDAVKTIIDSVQNVRLGLMVFNKNWDRVDATVENPPHGGRVVMKIDTMDAARRTEMKAVIDELSGHPPVLDLLGVPVDGGHTLAADSESSADSYAVQSPIAETLYEAYRYLAGLGILYGDDDTEVLPEVAAYTAFPPRDEDAEETDAAGDVSYKSPYNVECQQVYVIVVSDGQPSLDNNADSAIQTLAGISDCTDSAGNSCADDLAKYMYNNDVYDPGLDGTQRVVTYTIGVGVDEDSTEEAFLQRLADTDDGGNGEYHDGSNVIGVVSALRTAFLDIQTTNSSFAAPTLSVNAFNKLFNRDEVYFALFKPSATANWEGNIKKFAISADLTNCDNGFDSVGCNYGKVIDSNGDLAVDEVTLRLRDDARSFWSSTDDGGNVALGGAGAKLQETINGGTGRNLYAFDAPDYSSITFPLTLSSKSVAATSGNQLRDAAVTDPTILGLSAGASSDDVDKLIKWMLAIDTYDEDGDSDVTEARWPISDPLHSRPIAVSYGAASNCTSIQVADSTHGCYGRTAGDPNPDDPIIKLFVSTNDGVIHMINDDTGVEEWAFVVPEKLANQAALAEDNDTSNHEYGVDGTPSFWIVDNDDDGIIEPADNDKVYMYLGMRRGGSNIYAFNLTPSSTLSNKNGSASSPSIVPQLMWVIEGGSGNFASLGQTWSTPLVTTIRFNCTGNTGCDDGDATTVDTEANTVLIFGGGYDAGQDGTVNDTNGAGADSVGNAIYIANPLTGTRIWWAGNTGSGATLELAHMDYSIPSDLALMDSDGDGETDRVYVGDMGGQLWRLDLGQIKLNTNGGTSGARLADIACTADSRPLCAGTAVQDRRKFFYPPDVARVRDNAFSAIESDYDVVTIVSGDRADPTDDQTEGALTPVAAVKNKIYAFRDFLVDTAISTSNYPICADTLGTSLIQCLDGNADVRTLTESDLVDLTDNPLAEDESSSTYTTAKSSLRTGSGWFIELKEGSAQTTPAGNSFWVGEKGLARTIIFDHILFATTHVPASDTTASITCSKDEGLGRLYALNLYSATAELILDGGNTPTRSLNLGGGIPSELVTVIREGGVTGLVGVSGGTATPTLGSQLPRFTTFWYQE